MTVSFYGKKQDMTEAYLGDHRTAVTRIRLLPMKISQLKSQEKDHYDAAQVVFGQGPKNPSRALSTHLKAAGVKSGTLREIPASEDYQVGQTVNLEETLKPGVVVSVQGTSKGKGFAGVVKRYGFAGGFKTHGQSDRHRAPGSIGQGTTPGRVHKGKKMPGRMGNAKNTVKNLLCIAVSGQDIWIAGPVPGVKNNLLRLTITGEKEAPQITFMKGYQPVSEEKPAEEPKEVPAQEETPKAPEPQELQEKEAKQ